MLLHSYVFIGITLHVHRNIDSFRMNKKAMAHYSWYMYMTKYWGHTADANYYLSLIVVFTWHNAINSSRGNGKQHIYMGEENIKNISLVGNTITRHHDIQ